MDRIVEKIVTVIFCAYLIIVAVVIIAAIVASLAGLL